MKSVIIQNMLDISEPEHSVDITVRDDGEALWVNVDGQCVLRVCRIPKNCIVVDDARHSLQARQKKEG